MKSYHVTSGAGLDSLTLRQHDEPRPGPREVLVRVRASALNARELIILRGQYPLPVKPDLVPASDGAGEVVAVGPGVSRARVGDRVTASVFAHWVAGRFSFDVAAQLGGALDGWLADYIVVPEEAIVPIPAHLSFAEAAALPCAGVTAWNALTGGRPLLPGDVVLTLGSGGVSLLALQLARLHGARVIATTSSEDKAERLRALGAETVINYATTPDWHLAVRAATSGGGADCVIDVAEGGASLTRSCRAAAVQGQVRWVGAGGSGHIDLAELRGCLVTIERIVLGNRAQFEAMNRAIAAHGLRPLVDRVFPFAEARAAFAYFATGAAFGKVIIEHD